MKPKLYLLILASVSILVISCKTASKMYEKGNYDEAVELAAKKLQKNPNDAKLLDIIRNAYEYALNDHESKIRSHNESQSELKWEWLYYDYASLQKLYDAIYKVPSVFDIVQPVDYSSYMVEYAQRAGEVRYDRGISFMQHYDKKSYQKAYREFQSALSFMPGDRDAIMKLNEAYEYAVTNVVVLPMQQQGGFVYSSYTLGGNNLDDQLISNLQFSSGNEFVKFYSAWEARSKGIRTDQVIDMQFTHFNIGNYHDYKTTRRVSKEVVIKETVYNKDSVVKEYGTVYADITTTRRTMVSDARLQVNIRDENGGWLWNDYFTGNHNWSVEFATFRGDERALSPADKALVDRRPGYGPSESEISRHLIDEISYDLQVRVRNYFGRL